MPEKLTKDIIESEPAPKSGSTLLFDTEVKGFGARVFAPTKRHPAGARSFFLNYRVNRIERRYAIGVYPDWTVQQARDEARVLRKRVDRGEDPTLDKREREEAPTVRELAERYRDEHLPKKAKKSQHDDWTHLAKHVLPFKAGARIPKMGDRKVAEIHDGDIKALHTAITNAGHPILANRVLATTSKMFALSLQKMAGEDKAWRNAALGNPCKGVARNSEEGRDRFFSEAEMAAISDALNEYSNTERKHTIARESALASANCIRFIMLTGCRPDEAMRATWSQVDDEPGFWIKPSAHTKQRKVHKLALSPPALELVDRIRAGRQESDWIFPGQVKGDHIKQLRSCWDWVRDRATVLLWSENDATTAVVDGLRLRFDREPTVKECEDAAKVAKINKLPRGVAADRIYDLRHSFASFGAGGGVTLHVIGKLLGHTQARTTQRYAHLADDAMAAAAAKIGDKISNAGKGRDNVSALRGRG